MSTMSQVPAPESKLVHQILDIIAQEIGVSVNELSDESEFADIGVDTILAHQIVKQVLATTGVAIDATSFEKATDVRNFKQYVTKVGSSSLLRASQISESSSSVSNGGSQRTKPSAATKQSIAIRLQGDVDAPQKLFLLPDGSGSAMAYAQIPRLGSGIVVYGLNSPLLHQGPEFDGTIEDLAVKWAAEIRLVQPNGPYVLGGWSAGGYHSFEVAKQLMREGESVEKLVLLDSPCRVVFEALPMDVVNYLAAHNLMGNWGARKTPQWLVDHFDATIAAVERYRPTPMTFPTMQMPEVFIIWASDGLFPDEEKLQEHPQLCLKAEQTRVTKFLLQKRPKFGPHGWDQLFPNRKLAIATIPGHHFAVIHKPSVTQLGNLLLDIMRSKSKQISNPWRVVVPQ
ncbi:alpha/beta-hydrolase [Xylaria arbuscula]|nr:alpha/beta-hydrolase [Xylaria arbuscula]